MSADATQRCVRLANLSAEDYILARRTPVAVLHAVDGIESNEGVQITTTCNEMTVSMEPSIAESAPSDAVPCPAFDGTDDEWLHALLSQYAHGFTQDDLDLGYTEAVQHRIPTSDDAPDAQPYRSIPPNQLQEVKEHIKGLLAQKVIVDSHSAYAAPVVLVRKKDGSLRICIDYRRLNLKTVGDAYQLPRSPWMHWWGPSTSRPWTSPVGTTRSPWIPGTSTRQRSRHLSACVNTQGCRWAWRQPLPLSSV